MSMMGSHSQDAIISELRRMEASLRQAKQKEEKMLSDMGKMQKKIAQELHEWMLTC